VTDEDEVELVEGEGEVNKDKEHFRHGTNSTAFLSQVKNK
jgi:hypothetical protein